MVEQDIKRVLYGTLFLLGLNGEKWRQGPKPLGSTTYCLIEALQKSIQLLKLDQNEIYSTLNVYLKTILNELGYIGYPLVLFNDSPSTVFANVKELLEVAMNRIR